MSKITVIIPVYKVEPYLCRCIESVLAQTFTDYDVVLVDDGSPDKCGDICDAYAAKCPHIHVIHQENKGLSAARNAGIQWVFANSDSEWITFVDSDDWVSPLYLASLYHAAIESKTDVSICGFTRTFDEIFHDPKAITFSVWKVDKYFSEHRTNAIIACGKLFKKNCFHSLLFLEGRLHEDEFLIYKIMFQYDMISVIDQPLYAYYQNDNSIMRRKWSLERLDILDALEEQVEYFASKQYTELSQRHLSAWLTHCLDAQKMIFESEEISEINKRKQVRFLQKRIRSMLPFYKKHKWISMRHRCKYFLAYSGVYLVRYLRGFRCLRNL